MSNYKNKKILCIDNGLFVEFAATLAPSFGETFYYSPWEGPFPKTNHRLVGVGVPGVTRVNTIWDVVDEIDLFVFPDVNFGELQEYLVRNGKRVWGSKTAEFLELDRDASKQYCRAIGIDIGPYEVVRGIPELREYLQDNDDQYVKISMTRGDMETFHSPNYRLVEPKLDELEWLLGAKKDSIEFIVEEAINDAVEVGYDGYTIDGKYPDGAMWGVEIKDRGYLMECLPYAGLPSCVRKVNEKLSKPFLDYRYRGFVSTEIRATADGKAYLIDPCCRCGSPPNEIYQLMITNWDDIIWEGAGGTLVEPKFADKYGAFLMLHSSWADKNWQPIDIPPRLADYVKLRNFTVIDGRRYVVPQAVGLPEIGAVVATGPTVEAVVANVQKIAEQVQGYYVMSYPDSLDQARAEYDNLKALE